MIKYKKDKLTDLVKKYKKTKSKKIMGEIFIILNPIIESKASFVYNKENCYKMRAEDIKQELWLMVLKVIKNYNQKKSFRTYLYSSLWSWLPTLKKEDTIEHEMICHYDNKAEEQTEERFRDKSPEEFTSNITIEDILNECKTENEKKICELYLKNPKISEEEIAKKIGTYKMNISRILKGLRERLEKFNK